MSNGDLHQIYLTETSEVNERHRSKYIVHYATGSFYLNEFDTKEQLNAWCRLVGVTLTQVQTNPAWYPETVKTYTINKTVQEFSYWELTQVPQGSKKHKGKCNGSIVDCYVYVTDTSFAIFKPNPNARNVYVPLPFEEHMQYIKDKKKFLI